MPRVFRRIVLGLAGLVGVVFLLHVGLDTTHIFHQLFPVKSPEGLVPPFVNANHTATLVLWLACCLWFLDAHTRWHQWMRNAALCVLALCFCIAHRWAQ